MLGVTSAGELMLTITRRGGFRVVTRQSQDDFVPGKGIMLQLDPHVMIDLLLLVASHWFTRRVLEDDGSQ